MRTVKPQGVNMKRAGSWGRIPRPLFTTEDTEARPSVESRIRAIGNATPPSAFERIPESFQLAALTFNPQCVQAKAARHCQPFGFFDRRPGHGNLRSHGIGKPHGSRE